jgi:hypothetical protein
VRCEIQAVVSVGRHIRRWGNNLPRNWATTENISVGKEGPCETYNVAYIARVCLHQCGANHFQLGGEQARVWHLVDHLACVTRPLHLRRSKVQRVYRVYRAQRAEKVEKAEKAQRYREGFKEESHRTESEMVVV